MSVDPSPSNATPTTLLGDWHVNLLVWRPQLIHCMNDRSLLSVLIPARESVTFPGRLADALNRLLLRLGVSSEVVVHEHEAMNEFVVAPTNNRGILGCMRDAELALAYAVESGRYPSLEDLQWHLTEHIHRPTGYRHPGELAVELLAVAHA
jgi:hypothetical protein